MFLWNPYYLVFMAPAFLLVMFAQMWVNSTYRKWSGIPNRLGIRGGEAAQRLLQNAGLSRVQLETTSGRLSDHYDPRRDVLRLSGDVANGQSVAALAIAAHEIGHAMQDRDSYAPLRFRAALVPVVQIGSNLGWIMILIGLFLQGTLGSQLATIGLLTFATGTIFALATIPVELNASSRAKALLTSSGLITTQQERTGVEQVLRAAAFTYIAALAASLLQLLYYVSLVAGMGRRRR